MSSVSAVQQLWGDIPDAAPSPVGLSPAEIEALRRLPRPLWLEGPKIYSPAPPAACVTPTPSLPLSDIEQFNRSGELLETPPSWPIVLPPQLSRRSAHTLLRQGVGALCQFAGFEAAERRALDILVDATVHCLANLAAKLQKESEDRALYGPAHRGFTHAIERVFQDCLGQSVLALRPYITSIGPEIQRRIHLKTHPLSDPSSIVSSPLDETQVSGLATPSFTIGAGDVPEIHFPSSEEGDLAMDHATSQMETGLQMLQSLEQNASLGSHGAQRSVEAEDALQQPMSQDSNAALLLATVSPATPADAQIHSALNPRKRKKPEWHP
ncbi:uncharacterized protein LOC131886950 [Tigriopus californicus]|uniref:uncharacterized protein LOC131886950 n=1 Tax=Tigriopus californicus TaxID=6832 RepID=UPI0027D9FD8F|nr:uncharacterized protein LOC131886950 [Tigriopus californicus]